MRLYKCVSHAFSMVLHSRLRSWLTIIGIVIGVGSVVAIMSIGSGMQASMESQLGALGGDIITLSAGFSRGGGFFGRDGPQGGSSSATSADSPTLGRLDYQALRGVSDISLIDTRIRGNAEVTFLDSKGTVTLTGVDQKVWSQITTDTLADGRFLDPADNNVVVIGGRFADGYFSKDVGINMMLNIEGSSFRVVGILDDSSTSVYMPIQAAYAILDKDKSEYDQIIIKVKDEDDIDSALEKMEAKLMLVRHVTAKNKDFTLTSNKLMSATRNEMMSSMSAFLTAIAGVSLLVGAVGVANTMFTSVLEKTKEIGIMKAIGARNSDILRIFLLNAAFIGLVGGILGVILGMFLSGLMPSLMGTSIPGSRGGGLSTLVTLESVILALSVSTLTGLIAGAIPAYKASKLRPVDALRYD